MTTLPATVGKDPPAGKVTLFLMGRTETEKAAPIIGQVSVMIQLSKGPGAIPPGLDPGLDLMWKVLPRRAVADSFGNRVADGYFEIEAVLGNETGYDLQLSAVGFDVPQVYCRTDAKMEKDDAKTNKYNKTEEDSEEFKKIKRDDASWDRCKNGISTKLPPPPPAGEKAKAGSNSTILPVDSYPVVRGTVEREQSVGTRAFVVNLVKGASSVLVGVGGFYPDGGNFVRSSGIVSGPFEKALELVYPDLTTNHLISLDTRTLRDGVIVPNNTSYRINAFISREIVQCEYPKHWWLFGFTPHQNFYCLEDDGRLSWSRDFDPKQVMQRLGELNLVGRKIQYLERERVLTRTDNLPQSQGGPVLSTNAITVNRTKDQKFILSGTNLHGAAVTSSATCLHIRDQSLAADDTSLQFTLDSTECKQLDPLQLQVGSSHGFFLLNVGLAPPTVMMTDINLSKSSPFEIAGTSLLNATITSDQDLKITSVKPSDDGTKVDFEVDTKSVVAGKKYTLTIETPAGIASTRPTATAPAKSPAPKK